MTSPEPKISSAWWNGTRAALARVFGHVQVCQLGLETPSLSVGNGAFAAMVWAVPGSGLCENGWQPRAEMQAWQPLAAQKGGGDLNASSLPCFISESAVPYLGDDGVHEAKPDTFLPNTHTINIGQQGGTVTTVLPLPVHLSGGQPCAVSMAVLSPFVHAVSVVLAGADPNTVKREERSGVPVFRTPRTVSHLAKLTRVPLMARRALLPAGVETAQAFAAERRALAGACGAVLEDVKLLASFPHVPLSLVQQMAVTPNGDALRLWLRPESLAAGVGWTAARVTIVLGRRRSTGETIRAVLPEPHGAGRR